MSMKVSRVLRETTLVQRGCNRMDLSPEQVRLMVFEPAFSFVFVLRIERRRTLRQVLASMVPIHDLLTVREVIRRYIPLA